MICKLYIPDVPLACPAWNPPNPLWEMLPPPPPLNDPNPPPDWFPPDPNPVLGWLPNRPIERKIKTSL